MTPCLARLKILGEFRLDQGQDGVSANMGFAISRLNFEAFLPSLPTFRLF